MIRALCFATSASTLGLPFYAETRPGDEIVIADVTTDSDDRVLVLGFLCFVILVVIEE